MDEPLIDRLLHACVASCTCAIKSPEVKYHLPDCHYRLFSEARTELVGLTSALEDANSELQRLGRR